MLHARLESFRVKTICVPLLGKKVPEWINDYAGSQLRTAAFISTP